MSGICGFNWDDISLINKMIDSLKHRGLDGSGYYIDEQISLGHTLLSTLDLSEKNKQLIHNNNETLWIVFSGIIYNSKFIRSDLEKKGYEFSNSNKIDAELVLYAFEEFGLDCFTIFNGQFAFCIYDKNKSQIILVRDRIGIAPLYYLYDGNKLIFASEIKAILQHEIVPKINKDALREYFTFRYTLAPNTLFDKIKKLKASHFLIFSLKENKITLNPYFEFKVPQKRTYSIKESTNILFKLFSDSIKLRMVDDVPVACLLSGGIDSSVITGLASKIHPNIITISVAFETSSELNFAKLVSDHFNSNHYEFLIKDETIPSNIEKMIPLMEEPVADPGFLPTMIMCELASKYTNIVFGGDGADEIFGGYDKYKLYYYGRRLSYFIPKLKIWNKNEILSRLTEYSKLSESQGYLETIRVFDKNDYVNFGIVPKTIDRYWLNNGNIYQKMQYFDVKTLMPEDFFMEADKMGHAFGVGKRVPYMDHRVVEFALNLPTNLKLRIWNEKFLLKRTFSKLLPRIITKRRKKGFDVPIDYWFKTILDTKLIELLGENRHNLYNKNYVYQLLEKMKNSGNNYKLNFYLAQKLWTIYIFEEWYKRFMT